MNEVTKVKISNTQRERHREIIQKFPRPIEGRRLCTKCNKYKRYHLEDKLLSDFGTTTRKNKCGIKTIYPRSECKECEATRKREQRSNNREEYNAHVREYMRQYIQDPKNLEKKRKWGQEASATYRRKKGIPPSNRKIRGDIDKQVNAEPFLRYIEDLDTSQLDEPLKDLIRKAKSGRIQLGSVDRVLIALNAQHMLRSLYGES